MIEETPESLNSSDGVVGAIAGLSVSKVLSVVLGGNNIISDSSLDSPDNVGTNIDLSVAGDTVN